MIDKWFFAMSIDMETLSSYLCIMLNKLIDHHKLLIVLAGRKEFLLIYHYQLDRETKFNQVVLLGSKTLFVLDNFLILFHYK